MSGSLNLPIERLDAFKTREVDAETFHIRALCAEFLSGLLETPVFGHHQNVEAVTSELGRQLISDSTRSAGDHRKGHAVVLFHDVAPDFRDVCSCSVRTEYDLDALVLFVSKHRISARSILELHPVGDDDTGIDFAFDDPLQKRVKIALHRRLARLDRQRAVHYRTHGDLVHESAIHSGD